MEELKIIGYIVASIVLVIIIMNFLSLIHEANKPFDDKDKNPTDKL